MAKIGTMVMSINSYYNGKKVADMTTEEKRKSNEHLIEDYGDNR